MAAKLNGIKVEEFGLGFPPRVFGIKKGETIYSINALPLGGFVKVFGEEYYEHEGKVNKELKERGFVYKKPWQKSMVLVAGVFMNIVLAVVIFYGLLAANNFRSEPLMVFDKANFRFGQTEGRVVIANVTKDSPAQKAGIGSEDSVTQYEIDKDGVEGGFVKVTSAKELINAIKGSENARVELQLENIKTGEKRVVAVTPKYDATLKRAIIGAQLVDTVVIRYDTPTDRAFSGFFHSYNMSVYNLKTIGFLVQSAFKTKSVEPVSQSLSGPIGILAFVQDIVSSSGTKVITNLLNIMALFSLSLATINILPFPALDGGRLVLIIYEWITRRRPNATFERYYNAAGFAFLLLLMLVISINDITKLLIHH
jgi:regulator of sigma E protease